MAVQCDNLKKNLKQCSCTYTSCERRGKCCECLHYHLAMEQLPGCCFPADAERTYDRSFRKFIEVWSTRA